MTNRRPDDTTPQQPSGDTGQAAAAPGAAPEAPDDERMALSEAERRIAAQVAAIESGRDRTRERRLARVEDFVYDKAQEKYWDIEDGTLHSEKSVDAAIPVDRWPMRDDGLGAGREGGGREGGADQRRPRGRPRRGEAQLGAPSAWIRRVEHGLFVESATWWPGRPRIVEDVFIDASGPYPAAGRRSFNRYRPPPTPAPYEGGAEPWIEHVKKLWPAEAEHEFFFDYCAHMLQHPEEKCNTAIVLSGTQGIGKDAALLPVKMAVGAWNCKGIDPDELFSAFRPWTETLMLVVDEVKPTKDEYHATAMYNTLKPMIAAPPETLPMNDKHVKLRYVINVMRVFLTTNDWMSMYIPAEDRRMFIMHSNLPRKWHLGEQRPDYFGEFFRWMEGGGFRAVASWLAARDVSRFDPKAEAAKTRGWEAVAASWEAPEDAIAASLDRLGRPEVLFGGELLAHAFDDREELLGVMKSPRKFAHRMQSEGYMLMRSPKGDRWRFSAGEGRVYQSKVAFAHRDTLDSGRCMKLFEERGQKLAEGAKGEKSLISVLPTRG